MGFSVEDMLKEAMEKAEKLAELAKELDIPKIDSMLGKITPRELELIKKAGGKVENA